MTQRNIVLISVDSLRANACPWIENPGFQTPTISKASRDGISFTNAVSPGHATPISMPEIFTGLRLPAIDKNEPQAAITQYHETVPERLSRQGYSTIGFTPNPFTSREFGFQAGFDSFEDFTERDRTLLDRIRSYVRENWQTTAGGAARLVLNLAGQGDITVGWREYFEEILTAVDEASEPFFLWVFLLEPHWPYIPSSEHREDISIRDLVTNYSRSQVSNSTMTEKDAKILLNLYHRTVLDVDDFIEQLQSALAAYDPAYVFHSDHGELFGEHDGWGHQGDLFRENIHVPLEVWNTEITETISDPISLREIPQIINRIAEGKPKEIANLTSLYATAHNGEGTLSAMGNGWIHYPDGGILSPSEIRDIGDNILNRECQQISELRELRNICVDTATLQL